MPALKIEVSEELAQQIQELSKQVNSIEDHRETAHPYFYYLADVKKRTASEDENWDIIAIYDKDNISEGAIATGESYSEILDQLVSFFNSDIEEYEHVKKVLDHAVKVRDGYSHPEMMFDDVDIDDVLIAGNLIAIREVYEEVVKPNPFFTEEAAREHYHANKHHFNSEEPIVFGPTHCWRNPQMDILFELVCALSGGKPHK